MENLCSLVNLKQFVEVEVRQTGKIQELRGHEGSWSWVPEAELDISVLLQVLLPGLSVQSLLS